LARIDDEYEQMHRNIEQAIRSALRGPVHGASFEADLDRLLASLERLDRVAVRFGLEGSKAELVRLPSLCQSIANHS
jgi:hypothetical protein